MMSAVFSSAGSGRAVPARTPAAPASGRSLSATASPAGPSAEPPAAEPPAAEPATGAAAPAPEALALLLGSRASVYAFIRSRGFSGEDADDLTQETLLRAYTRLSGWRGSAMGPWLCTIARNLTVDYHRRRRLSTVPLEDAPSEAAVAPDPLERLLLEEWDADLRRWLEQLPERHRQALHMRYFEQRSLPEIAAQLLCTPEAAKVRIFRALAALRKAVRGV